jgi:tRNA-splicing ligase RtcB
MSATLHAWRAGPPNPALDEALARLCRADDVVQVAVMPDAHVADAVCVGTVTATTRRILPAAVGGDIGCGMSAVCLQASADRLRDAHVAARILDGLSRAVPPLVQRAPPALHDFLREPLSAPLLERLKERDGRLELGTLGRGNHFLEVQRDDTDTLWLMVHSGSRCMGPAIRRHHEASADRDGEGFLGFDDDDARGSAYLADAAWAARYAALNREIVTERACAVLADALGAAPDLATTIRCDHNHVQHELHGERWLWVHRKGAQRAASGLLGIVPGSMGSPSFHVEGRGEPSSLLSAAHGAGRVLSRGVARQRIRARDLDAQMRGVWFDARLRDALREEAPRAYKDIGEVMRAQRELVRIVRRLTPVLVYKAV